MIIDYNHLDVIKSSIGSSEPLHFIACLALVIFIVDLLSSIFILKGRLPIKSFILHITTFFLYNLGEFV